jgi:hypothetical protein
MDMHPIGNSKGAAADEPNQTENYCLTAACCRPDTGKPTALNSVQSCFTNISYKSAVVFSESKTKVESITPAREAPSRRIFEQKFKKKTA